MSISGAIDRDLANVRPLREQRQATRVAFCVPHPGDTVRSLPQQATLKATALGLFEEVRSHDPTRCLARALTRTISLPHAPPPPPRCADRLRVVRGGPSAVSLALERARFGAVVARARSHRACGR